jgi:membrane associated rhomboid family serine protease
LLPLRDNIPTDRFPVLTTILIAINVLVFVWLLTLSGEQVGESGLLSESDEAVVEYGAIPYRLTNPGEDCSVTRGAEVVCTGSDEYEAATRSGGLVPLDDAAWWVTIFTSMFMHGGFLHLAGNMLFLWVFGNNIEDSMGKARYLAFYLLAGIVAVYAQTLLEPDSTVPTIGASGAVAGVLGGYILLHPRARVLTLVFIIFFVTFIEVPAMVMLGLWFVLQLIPAVGQVATPELAGESGGVAYLAHLGGFAFGLAMIKLFASRRRGPPRPAIGA